MGIRNFITKTGIKAADKIADLSTLSPEQLNDLAGRRGILDPEGLDGLAVVPDGGKTRIAQKEQTSANQQGKKGIAADSIADCDYGVPYSVPEIHYLRPLSSRKGAVEGIDPRKFL